MIQDIEKFPKYSRRNREAVSNSDVCSCYFCLGSFSTSDISDWADDGDTAICPHCDVDAILPGLIGKELLIAAKVRFFTKVSR